MQGEGTRADRNPSKVMAPDVVRDAFANEELIQSNKVN